MSFHSKLTKGIGCVLAAAIAVGAAGYLIYAANRTAQKSGQETPASFADRSEIHSGRHAQFAASSEPARSPYTVDGFTLRLASNTLQVWVRENTSQLRIVDRRSDYVWGLAADEKPDTLNKSWYELASSLCAIEYFDEKDAVKRASSETANAKLRYDWGEDSFVCKVDLPKQGFRFSVGVALQGDTLSCRIVDGSLEEYGKNKLKSLCFLPFLGSTYSDDISGYFFVPDGCGALIRFQKPSAYNAALEGRVFGEDAGIDPLASPGNLLASRGNDYLVPENGMTLPVYGIVHGEGHNGIFAMIRSDVEQVSISANPAGLTTDHNWITAQFAYRSAYLKPVNKAGAGVYTAQETMNVLQPAVDFVFLTGEDADYSSMAVYYRNRLVADGLLSRGEAQGEIPLWLSVLGAEIKEGVLYNTTQVLTSVEEAQSITQRLQGAGIGNLHACYYGWEKGGVNGAKYGEVRLDGRLGSTAALHSWAESVAQSGGRLSLYRNLGQANEDQISLRRDAALNISSAYTRYTVDNSALLYPDAYVIRTDKILENYESLCEKWPELHFSLDNIGKSPASNYGKGAEYTRLETMELLRDMVKKSENKASLFQPAMYYWDAVSEYLDISMSSSQYLFETDTVPFLQIVLKGYVDYYAPYINLGFYSQNAVLKMVEFGAYPAYIVAEAESHKLEKTPLENMFSVNFGDWEEHIAGTYAYVSRALLAVEGKEITEHRMVAEGVARVSYSGNISIYVNYNNTDAATDGVVVPAGGYLVKGGSQ